MSREKSLQARIKNDLKNNHKAVVFNITPGIYSTRNIPDLFFTTEKTGPVWIEIKKSDSKDPSPGQGTIIDRLNSHGCHAFVVGSWQRWIDVKWLLFN